MFIACDNLDRSSHAPLSLGPAISTRFPNNLRESCVLHNIHLISPNLTWFHLILLDLIRFYLISPDFTWSCLISHDFIRSDMISPDLTWFHLISFLISSDFTWHHLTSPDFTWYHMILPDLSWSHMISLNITNYRPHLILTRFPNTSENLTDLTQVYNLQSAICMHRTHVNDY